LASAGRRAANVTQNKRDQARAGGLVPLHLRYPGASEFAAEHKKAFPDADFSYHTAETYGACRRDGK
jgi:hypothetical protein